MYHGYYLYACGWLKTVCTYVGMHVSGSIRCAPVSSFRATVRRDWLLRLTQLSGLLDRIRSLQTFKSRIVSQLIPKPTSRLVHLSASSMPCHWDCQHSPGTNKLRTADFEKFVAYKHSHGVRDYTATTIENELNWPAKLPVASESLSLDSVQVEPS